MLSVIDHGITTGDGVFESVKVVDGVPFALSRHLARLAQSATGLGLPKPDDADVRRAVQAVVDGEPMPYGVVRITYTAGPGPLGSSRGDSGPTLLVIACATEPKPPTAAAIVVPWTRNERGALAGLKTTSYAENVRALAYAAEHGGSEALFTNTAGMLCEGTGSNIFCVFGDEIATPPLSAGCLAGVSRALVIEWCQVTERDISLDELAAAEEVFLTSTTRDVQALYRVDDRELTAPGPVTKDVLQTWRAREATDNEP